MPWQTLSFHWDGLLDKHGCNIKRCSVLSGELNHGGNAGRHEEFSDTPSVRSRLQAWPLVHGRHFLHASFLFNPPLGNPFLPPEDQEVSQRAEGRRLLGPALYEHTGPWDAKSFADEDALCGNLAASTIRQKKGEPFKHLPPLELAKPPEVHGPPAMPKEFIKDYVSGEPKEPQKDQKPEIYVDQKDAMTVNQGTHLEDESPTEIPGPKEPEAPTQHAPLPANPTDNAVNPDMTVPPHSSDEGEIRDMPAKVPPIVPRIV